MTNEIPWQKTVTSLLLKKIRDSDCLALVAAIVLVVFVAFPVAVLILIMGAVSFVQWAVAAIKGRIATLED
jgi:hypothetical protein